MKNPDKKIEKIRKLFPVLKKSIYFNHAAVSPLSKKAGKEIRKFIKARTDSDNVDLYPKTLEMIESVRKKIADMVNSHPDNISLVKNTSEALNIFASGLDLKPKDRILLFEREFPANVYPFLNLKRKGVEIDFVPERENKFLIEDIIKAIKPTTRVISVSHVEFLTGFRQDLSAISEICRENNIIFCVDAIQSAGVIPIDVEAMGIDFIACGGHKWLMGPMGTAFLYIRRTLLETLSPQYAGWLSVNDSWDFFKYELDLLPTARRFEGATQNFMGFYGLDASLSILLDIGFPGLTDRILFLTGRLINGLKERNIKTITPDDDSNRAGIVTFFVDESEKVFRRLEEKKVFIALRNGLLRASPHFYNCPEEIDEFLIRLDDCIKSN